MLGLTEEEWIAQANAFIAAFLGIFSLGLLAIGPFVVLAILEDLLVERIQDIFIFVFNLAVRMRQLILFLSRVLGPAPQVLYLDF